MNKALATGGAMATAAVLTQEGLLKDTISMGAYIADSIVEKTGNAVETVMNLGNGTVGQILNPLASIYGGIKVSEVLDDNVLKLENKYGKFLWKTFGGVAGAFNPLIAAPIGVGVATYKGVKWAGGGAIKGVKALWGKGYSKSS